MMAARRVPASERAISDRLAAAGFRRVDGRYERRHDRDPSYVVRVYVAPTLIRVEAVHCVGKGECGVAKDGRFTTGYVDRTAPIETMLDRLIEAAREAYAAINHHRRGTT